MLPFSLLLLILFLVATGAITTLRYLFPTSKP
jgi:hypothetical protein